MKKVIPFIIGFSTLISISYGYEKIYDLPTKEQTITSGVTYQAINRFTTAGWIDINIMKVDLENDNVKVDLLTPTNGMYNIDNVLNQATINNAVAAINGEFFTKVGNNAYSIGFSMKDENVTSSPYYGNSTKDTIATMLIDKKDNVTFEYVKLVSANVENSKGVTVKVAGINESSKDFLTPMIYTSDWSNKSFGNTKFYDTLEIVVENDKVKEIRNGAEPVEIPYDGYVITARGDSAYSLKTIFKKGDKIKLNIETNIDYDGIRTAISGGALLVQDGKIVTNFSHEIAGYNPRTAVGISKDGNTMFLVTVDGRGASKGMTQAELANIMHEIGCFTALNLDGGGSTQMVGRIAGETGLKILNTPSEIRKVVNSLGVISTKSSSINSLSIDTSNDKVLKGHSVTLFVKGYDKYLNTCEVDQSDVSWKISGVTGSIKNGVFTPKSSGIAKITATYKRKKETIEIEVYNELGILNLNADKISLKLGETFQLEVSGKTADGYTLEYGIEDFEFSSSNDCCSVSENGLIKAEKPGYSIITIKSGNTSVYVGIGIAGKTEVLIDDFEKQTASFHSYPSDSVFGELEYTSEERCEGSKAARLSYDFSNTDIVRGAYINFNEEIIIDKTVEYISFYAFSERVQSKVSVKLQIEDANGNEKLVTVSDTVNFNKWTKLKYETDNIKLPAKLQRIYVAQADGNGTAREIYIDNLCFYQYTDGNTVNLDMPQNTKVIDLKEREEKIDKNGYSIALIGGKVKEKTLYDVVKNSAIDKIKENNNCIIEKTETIPYSINLDADMAYEYKNSYIITLNNWNGLSTAQWKWFSEYSGKAVQENFILVLRNPVENSFQNAKEQLLFEQVIKDKEEAGINVTIIYFGEKTGYTMYNGIKQFTICNKEVNDLEAKIDNDKYIKIVVNDDDVTYQVLSIYE